MVKPNAAVMQKPLKFQWNATVLVGLKINSLKNFLPISILFKFSNWMNKNNIERKKSRRFIRHKDDWSTIWFFCLEKWNRMEDPNIDTHKNQRIDNRNAFAC